MSVALNFEQPQGNPGQVYAVLWREMLAKTREYRKVLDDLLRREHEAFGMEPYLRSFPGEYDFKAKDLLEKAAQSIARRLASNAEERFAPSGASLDIPSEDLWDRLPKKLNQYERSELDVDAFDPEAIWAWLEQTYGGDAGESEAYRQTAQKIVDLFRLNHNPVEHKAGCVVLNLRVWEDSIFTGRLSADSRDRWMQACQTISEFAGWAGLQSLRTDLTGFRRFHGFDDRVESRTRYAFGNSAITLITYKNRFELRLKPDVAAKLQEFIGAYSPIGGAA